MSMSPQVSMTAGGLLRELKDAHRQVQECTEEMEVVTSAATADKLAYTSARYRISRASMARRACLHVIRADFSDGCSTDREAIENIVRLDRQTMVKSAAHVRRWTAQSIDADWAGYCDASRRIRRQMASGLEAEERLLFPILELRCFDARPRSRFATLPTTV